MSVNLMEIVNFARITDSASPPSGRSVPYRVQGGIGPVEEIGHESIVARG
jgi:hypothetical protein